MPKVVSKVKKIKAVKKEKQPAKQRVLVSFIQDHSGSMQDMWAETVNGFRIFVDSLKKNTEVDYRFTLTVFDDVIETPFQGIPISEIPSNALTRFGPRGSTALYDAVGKTLESTGKWSEFDAQKVIVVITTDGQENCSREWNKNTIHTAIHERLKSGRYTFTYMGTQPETWADAGATGIAAGSTVVYRAGQVGATYSIVGQSVNAFASSSNLRSANMIGTYGDAAAVASAGMTVSPDKDDLTINNGINLDTDDTTGKS